MGKEQELRPDLPTFLLWVADSYEALASVSTIPEEIEGFKGSAEMAREHHAALARRSSDEQAEVVESRDVLFFASYCGGDSPACTPARPCADCIAMGNVYSIPANTPVLFQREFGASPPAVAASGVTEAMVDLAWRRLNGAKYITPDDVRAALLAALADEGIREGERLALLVEELAGREKPGRSKLMLMIAARAVRRGRLLTSAEQLENVERFLTEGEDADAVTSK